MENTKVRDWYMKEFPDDELGQEIKKGITFYDVFEKMDRYKDIYDDILEVRDSVIRERVFGKLADIMGVDYEEVYQQWILSQSK